jgi:hypothetical protein
MGAFGNLLITRWGFGNSSAIHKHKTRTAKCPECGKKTKQMNMADFGMNPKWYCFTHRRFIGTGCMKDDNGRSIK